MNVSSLGQSICIIVSEFLPIILHSFDTIWVVVVIYAHLLGLFYVWCFCPLDNLAFEIHQYNYHTDIPNGDLYIGILQVFCCSVILDAVVRLGC